LQFYSETNLDPRIPFSRKEFVSKYNLISNFEMFSFIPLLGDGFKPEYLNINSDMFKDFASAFSKKNLGGIGLAAFTAKLKKSSEIEEESATYFSDDDFSYIKKFFDEKILN